MRKVHVILLILVLAGGSWLTTLVDDGLGVDWAHNVVRNWEQFGFFKLHGELVYNPGGYQSDSQPEIYAGHHPAGLYLVFAVQKILPGAGALVYYGVVAALVFFGIWYLLGRTQIAFLIAGVAVLTPGYLLWQTTLDPNLASVMAGFPFCAAVIWLLQKGPLRLTHAVGLLLLIIIYSAINWTTVFVQGILFAALMMLPAVSRRNLVTYAALAVVPMVLVVVTSFINKMTNNHSGSDAGFMIMLRGYGWGNWGYGLGLSTRTAFTRLLFVNLIGFFPLLAVLGVELWRGRFSGWKDRNCLIFLPLVAAAFCVAVLRNYFGHHPWMSCSFILLGLILSLVIWRARRAVGSVDENRAMPLIQWTTLTVSFAYAFVVLSFYHLHNGQELDAVRLIRNHTPRTATILVSRDTDPALAQMQDRLPELFDRHLVVLDNTPDPDPATTNAFWLTSASPPQGGHHLVAGDSGDAEPGRAPLIGKLLNWYTRSVAHRRQGDKMDFGAKYYLYQ